MSFLASTFGTTARWSFAEGWQLAGAVFRALYYSPISYNPLLLDITGANVGDYQVDRAAGDQQRGDLR